MGIYTGMIREATGETDKAKLDAIEDFMRHGIFHSTLDWQTRKQLDDAALEAQAILNDPQDAGAEGG